MKEFDIRRFGELYKLYTKSKKIFSEKNNRILPIYDGQEIKNIAKLKDSFRKSEKILLRFLDTSHFTLEVIFSRVNSRIQATPSLIHGNKKIRKYYILNPIFNYFEFKSTNTVPIYGFASQFRDSNRDTQINLYKTFWGRCRFGRDCTISDLKLKDYQRSECVDVNDLNGVLVRWHTLPNLEVRIRES